MGGNRSYAGEGFWAMRLQKLSVLKTARRKKNEKGKKGMK